MTRANLSSTLLFCICLLNLVGAMYSVSDREPWRALMFGGFAVATFVMGRWSWDEDALERLGTVDRHRETYCERTHRHD